MTRTTATIRLSAVAFYYSIACVMSCVFWIMMYKFRAIFICMIAYLIDHARINKKYHSFLDSHISHPRAIINRIVSNALYIIFTIFHHKVACPGTCCGGSQETQTSCSARSLWTDCRRFLHFLQVYRYIGISITLSLSLEFFSFVIIRF